MNGKKPRRLIIEEPPCALIYPLVWYRFSVTQAEDKKTALVGVWNRQTKDFIKAFNPKSSTFYWEY